MPRFDYKCPECKDLKELYVALENLEHPQTCTVCDRKMNRLITRNFNVNPDIQPYLERNLSHQPIWIKSNQHKRELCKQHEVYEKFGSKWY